MGAASAPGERYFFVHLQKTAGTTLRQRLMHLLGEEAMYPSEYDGDMVGEGLTYRVAELERRLPRRAAVVRVIFGHFPMCTMELLGGDFHTLTMLREPVERALSYLRHHREWTPADQHRSLEEIYEDPVRHRLACNHMTTMFSLSLDEMDDGMLSEVELTPDHLARAKEALTSIEVVGVQERFEDFVVELNRCFGWELGDRPRFANRTQPVEVPPSFRARIIEDNRFDQELYDHALQLIEHRRRARPDSAVAGADEPAAAGQRAGSNE
jgi:hypothetical protein